MGAGTQVSETLSSSLLHVLDTQRGRGSGQSTLSTPHVSPISQGGGHRSRKELRNGQLLEKGLEMETKPLGYVNTDSTLNSCGGYAGRPQHIAHFAGIKGIYTGRVFRGIWFILRSPIPAPSVSAFRSYHLWMMRCGDGLLKTSQGLTDEKHVSLKAIKGSRF